MEEKKKVLGCQASWKCMTCKYAPTGVCDYAAITRHCRIKICPPGDECTVYSPAPGQKAPERPLNYGAKRKPTAQDYRWRQMRELYDQGLNDKEIAAEMGCGRTTVQRWRHSESLAPIKQKPHKRGHRCT